MVLGYCSPGFLASPLSAFWYDRHILSKPSSQESGSAVETVEAQHGTMVPATVVSVLLRHTMQRVFNFLTPDIGCERVERPSGGRTVTLGLSVLATVHLE